MTKTEYFFQQHWESEYFFRKKPYPPFQVKWSFPKIKHIFRTVEVYSLRGDVQRC